MEIKDVGLAVRLFYEKVELNNKDIGALFGTKCRDSIARIKRPVLEKMAEEGIRRYNPHAVNTDVAYAVWGLDIDSLERRYRKLQKLGFVEGSK